MLIYNTMVRYTCIQDYAAPNLALKVAPFTGMDWQFPLAPSFSII
jgi:hypothetical protein